MARTLLLTNAFPPRQSGEASFLFALASRLPADEVVVYTGKATGSGHLDRSLPFRVIRGRSSTLRPGWRLANELSRVLRRERCTSVLYGSAAPLAQLAPRLRAAGATRQIALTHGLEVAWARRLRTRAKLRRIGERTDALTYLGDYSRHSIADALTSAATQRMVSLAPGVDVERFGPRHGGDELRGSWGIDPTRPVVLTVARLVPHKGVDTLIRTWPEVLDHVPDALLLVVGSGPDRERLEKLVAVNEVQDSVLFAGQVDRDAMPAYYSAADVYARVGRSSRFGRHPELPGLTVLEASASGLPVLVGDSGGATETCRDGETGFVVNPRAPGKLAARLVALLQDPATALAMGARGQDWMAQEWGWDSRIETLRELLGSGPTT